MRCDAAQTVDSGRGLDEWCCLEHGMGATMTIYGPKGLGMGHG